jgi:hypothetical protein
MTVVHIWAIVFAILSVNCKSETERVGFKILAILCLLIPFLSSVIR